jgi:hypothetical protein
MDGGDEKDAADHLHFCFCFGLRAETSLIVSDDTF